MSAWELRCRLILSGDLARPMWLVLDHVMGFIDGMLSLPFYFLHIAERCLYSCGIVISKP